MLSTGIVNALVECMIYVAVPFIVCVLRAVNFRINMKQNGATSASSVFCWESMLDDVMTPEAKCLY